jgi:hypothetical protein
MNFSNYNETNNHSIEEDKPKFRRVAMMPQEIRSLPTMPQMKQFHVIKEKQCDQPNHSSPKARWIVTQPKKLPIFGLEPGSHLIHAPASVVAARIDDSLRLRSVQAQFNVDDAEATCKTNHFLQYKIFLYAGPENESTYVEMIRWSGCGYAFNKERRAIVKAAKGLGADSSALHNEKQFNIPSNLRHLYVPPTTSDLQNILDRATDNFHSNDRHTLLLTLQNLVSMTNASNDRPETAQNMSKLIMQNTSQARDMIVSTYAAAMRDMRNEMNEQICHACLSILANGMIALSDQQKDAFLDKECGTFVDDLVPCLVESVGRYKCTHNACLALRCFCLLIRQSSWVCDKARDMEIRNIIEQAELYGRREHLNLEKAARSSLDMLQCEIFVS